MAKLGFEPKPSGFRVLALKHSVDASSGQTGPSLFTGCPVWGHKEGPASAERSRVSIPELQGRSTSRTKAMENNQRAVSLVSHRHAGSPGLAPPAHESLRRGLCRGRAGSRYQEECSCQLCPVLWNWPGLPVTEMLCCRDVHPDFLELEVNFS